MKFEIEPYTGPRPLLLGMSSHQIVQILGQPSVVSKNRLGETTHNFEHCAVGYDKDVGVSNYFGFTPGWSLFYKSVNLFDDPAAFRFLINEDGEPFEFVGFILLLKLGISLSGFHDGDKSQLAVNMYARGRYDQYRNQFRPLEVSPESLK